MAKIVYRQRLVSTTPVGIAQAGEQWRAVRYQVLGANVRVRYDDEAASMTAETGGIVYATSWDVINGGIQVQQLHWVREADTDAVIHAFLER